MADGCSRRPLPLTHEFRHKLVRDLVWVVTSPQLISEQHFPLFSLQHTKSAPPDCHEWLHALDEEPTPLVEFLQAKTPKQTLGNLALGIYFAGLIEFWLLFCPCLRLSKFAANTQLVSSSNQTIGQLKFLFRLSETSECGGGKPEKRQEQDYHVEASVKFFMLHPLDAGGGLPPAMEGNEYPLEQFVGPHLGENLAWRVQEVQRKVAMARGDAVKKWLEQQYSDSVRSQVILRGYLFYPLHLFSNIHQVNASGHRWELNPDSSDPIVDGLDSSSTCVLDQANHQLARDHLRGWWTRDFESEMAARLGSTAPDACRFIVLPKLHWLSPLIAYEAINDDADPTDRAFSRVIVPEERELRLSSMETLCFNEVVQFLRAHFLKEQAKEEKVQEALSHASTWQRKTERNSKRAGSGMVMPVLIAHLEKQQDCFGVSDQQSQWIEVSRGFVVDDKCWNPLPLCHDAVRYRRTVVDEANTNDNGLVMEREYEGRSSWRFGRIKTSEEEDAEKGKKTAIQRNEQNHIGFSHPPGAITAERMCRELLVVAPRTRASQANWIKQIVKVLASHGDQLLQHGEQTMPSMQMAHFVLCCLDWLVHEELENQTPNTDERVCMQNQDNANDTSTKSRNVAQRVAHLVLDALDTFPSPSKSLSTSISSDENKQFQSISQFLFMIADHKRSWGFVNVTLRFLSWFVRCFDHKWLPSQQQNALRCVERFLSAGSQRANAFAIETLRVFDLQHHVRYVFDALCLQKDWITTELLVLQHLDQDEMVQTFVSICYELKLRRSLKRIHKKKEQHEDTVHKLVSDSCDATSKLVNPHKLLDLEEIRAKWSSSAFHLEYVTTSSQLLKMVEYVRSIAMTSSQDKDRIEFVGLDCEWRPSFLATPTKMDEESSTTNTHGVSIYQLAIEERVFVVDVMLLGKEASTPLTMIQSLPSKRLTLVGFCVQNDIRRLEHSFPAALCSSLQAIELRRLAVWRLGSQVSPWGLNQLNAFCLGEHMEKDEQCSDWGSRPLSDHQLLYAAKDAFAARNLAMFLTADLAAPSPHAVNNGQHSETEKRKWMETFLVPQATNGAVYAHGLLTVEPLSLEHVHNEVHRLVDQEVEFFTVMADEHEDDEKTRPLTVRLAGKGAIVKTIAICIKGKDSAIRSPHTTSLQCTLGAFEFAAVVLRIDQTIDMAALARLAQVDQHQLVLADPITLVATFGFSRGCLGPIGLRDSENICVVVDHQLLQEDQLLCGAGQEHVVYAIAPSVLTHRLRNVVVASIATQPMKQ